jgi:hypothetical protein
MRKRIWPGNPKCSFCDQLETRDDFFYHCALVKVVWGII